MYVLKIPPYFEAISSKFTCFKLMSFYIELQRRSHHVHVDSARHIKPKANNKHGTKSRRLKQFKVDKFAALFNYTPVDRASDSMIAPT